MNASDVKSIVISARIAHSQLSHSLRNFGDLPYGDRQRAIEQMESLISHPGLPLNLKINLRTQLVRALLTHKALNGGP